MSQTALATDLKAARAAQQGGQPAVTLQKWLQRHHQAIASRLPPGQRAQGEDRYVRLLLSEMQRTPLLMECLRSVEGENSLRDAIFRMTQLGLEPGPLGHCFLLPFRDSRKGLTTCTYILGYKGIMELAWRSDRILSIKARVVYAGDVFDFADGLNDRLVHIPGATGPLAERTLTYAYALARFKNGGYDFMVLDADTVNFYRTKSRAQTEPYSPWNQFTAAMWRKTAVRRLADELPLTSEVASELVRDEAREMGLSDAEPVPLPEATPAQEESAQ